MTTLHEKLRKAASDIEALNLPPTNIDGLRHMAQAMAIAQIPRLAQLRQVTADAERAVADLCAVAACDLATIERAVGMAYPRSTNEELLSMSRDASALAEFAQTVVEFGRRVEYAMRRYQRNGRFDEVTP